LPPGAPTRQCCEIGEIERLAEAYLHTRRLAGERVAQIAIRADETDGYDGGPGFEREPSCAAPATVESAVARPAAFGEYGEDAPCSEHRPPGVEGGLGGRGGLPAHG